LRDYALFKLDVTYEKTLRLAQQIRASEKNKTNFMNTILQEKH